MLFTLWQMTSNHRWLTCLLVVAPQEVIGPCDALRELLKSDLEVLLRDGVPRGLGCNIILVDVLDKPTVGRCQHPE